MRRYETTCNRYVDRYLSDVLKRKSSNSGDSYAPAAAVYTRPRPQVFQPDRSPERITRKGRDGRFDRFDPQRESGRFKLEI